MRRRKKFWRGICGWERKNEKETVLTDGKVVAGEDCGRVD